MNYEWIDAFLAFWRDSVCRASIQATVGIVLLLLIERAVPWLSANVRSWLWRLVFVKLALVMCLPLAWQLPILPAMSSRPQVESRSNRSVQISEVLVESTESADSSAIYRSSQPGWIWMAFLVWSLCVAAQIGSLIVHWRRAWSLVRTAVPCTDPVLLDLLNNVAGEIQSPRVPRLLMVSGISSPMVVGHRHPCLLWPVSFTKRERSRLSNMEDRRMALAHEMAHVLRHDLEWNLLAAMVNTLLCFHPAMWLASRRYVIAQESACDDLAVRRARLNKVRFAELLIRVSQRPRQRVWSPASVSLVQGHGIQLLRERLKHMQQGRSNRVRQLVAGAASALGLALAILPWSVGFAQSGNESSSKQTRIKSEKSSGGGASASASSSGSASGFGSASSSGGGSSSGDSSGTSGGSSGGSGRKFSGGNSGGSSVSGGSAKSNSKASVSVNGGSGGAADGTLGGRGGNQMNKSSESNSTTTTNGVQVTTHREMTDEGEEIRVTAQEKLRDIQIRQSETDGIEVFIRPTKKNPDQTITNVTAATADELKSQNLQAYEVYRKYLQSNLKKIRTNQAQNKDVENAGTETEANPAQQLMIKHLRELLEKEDLPAANRSQIEQMLSEFE
ncbi:MAG: M56 family metallopeptidase [Planctomycetota bacterium]